MAHQIEQQDLEMVYETLLAISQIADWLASLNAESHEVSNGLSLILCDLRDKADFAYHTLIH